MSLKTEILNFFKLNSFQSGDWVYNLVHVQKFKTSRPENVILFSPIIESYFILRAFKVKLIQSAQDLMFFWEREVHPQTFIHF